jgi:hypothetical protein
MEESKPGEKSRPSPSDDTGKFLALLLADLEDIADRAKTISQKAQADLKRLLDQRLENAAPGTSLPATEHGVA